VENHKAGFVSILGLPNAGKSTLLNALLGQKLSIITNKPQTTRKRILGILTDSNYQVIFFDTPGILNPSYLLQEKMMEQVQQSVYDGDVLLFIVDLENDPSGEKFLNDEYISSILSKKTKPFILVLNKIDKSSQEKVTSLVELFEEKNLFTRIIPVSALLAANVAEVLNAIIELLPENPNYYPDDIVADANERFFVSEIIREKIFQQYQEEIPYSTEVIIAEFSENEGRKDYIRADIIIEKDSQKGILIGKQGLAIKKLGQSARFDIEKFLDRPVFLELRIKVKAKWRSDEKTLKDLGYTKDNV
jgi:GTP-binding protein Era